MTETAGALRGIRVLDFGHYIAGPMLAMLLADQGAEVIKVEPPGGEPGRRSIGFEAWNRGKRSMVADLKDETDRASVLSLARDADVAIENFRPGVADRLGIGAATLRALNPALIYCSLPGFGAESPYRNEPAWEGIVGARTGLYRPNAHSADPVHPPLAIGSTFAAIVAAAGVAAALLARDRDGEGQTLEVPLHAATFLAKSVQLLRRETAEPPAAGSPGPRPLVRTYRCADDRYIQFHVGVEKFAREFFTLTDQPDLLDLVLRQQGTGDELALELLARFEAMFLTRPAADWEALCVQAKVPGVLCRTREEWLAHPHTAQTTVTVPSASSEGGETRQSGIAVRLLGTPGAVTADAPALDPDATPEWLDTGRSGDRPLAAATKGGEQPLHGVRVLDLTIFLAGPTCGRTLAELGADVIKIDDPNRSVSAAFSGDPDAMRLDVDRGKRSMLLDLKTERGHEVFWHLVEQADVVVENFRPGALDRIGLGYADVSKRRPDLVYASLSAYGQAGPWSPRPGFEVTTQAVTGTQVRQGRGTDTPATLPLAPNDYGTGVLGAFGVMLALAERRRNGRGQHVDAALVYTASAMQADWLLDGPGRATPEVEGLRGPSARSRLYATSDGWLYLHLTGDDDVARLLQLDPFASASNSDDPEWAAALAEVFARRPTAEWLGLLHAAGLSAAPNASPDEFLSDPTFEEAGIVVSRDHPKYGRITHLGDIFRLDRTPSGPGRPVEPLGWSTDDILTEAGFTAADVATLRGDGVVG